MKKLIKLKKRILLFFFASFHVAFPMPKASDKPKSPTAIPTSIAPSLPIATAPVAPSISTPLPTTTSSLQPQQEEQALNDLKNIMKSINSLKDGLKNKLKELDDKLYEARQAAVEGKKISFEILQQDSQHSARNTFDQVKEKLNQIKNTQTFVQGQFTKDFNQQIAEFNSLVAKLQSKKSILATLRPQITPPTQTNKPTPPQPVQTSQTKPIPSHTKEDSTFLNTVSNLTARAITWIKKTTNWILESSEPTDQKKTKNSTLAPSNTLIQQPAKASGPLSMPTVNAQQTTSSSPATTLQTPPPTPIPAATNDQELQAQIPMFDSLVKELDAMRLQLNDRYQAMRKTQKILYTYLSQYPQLQENIKPKTLHTTDATTKWKNMILTIVSKVFDVTAWAISQSIDLTRQAYKNVISPLLNKFTKDVQAKVKDLEEKQQKSA